MIRRHASVVGALLLLAPTAALAHAHLSNAAPAENAVVVAPPQVTLTFSEALEKRFSTIEVLDATGKRVDDGRLRPDTGPRQLAIGLPVLPAGRYKVIWHATSVDTHRTAGDFTFAIAP
jgi:methionine-rich copper-binding protein CopC